MTAPHVYQAINHVTSAMAAEGLPKSRSNVQQGYKFRGIDDVYCAIARHLATAKLCILPRVIERSVSERATKSGGVSTYTVLTVEFDLVSSLDGSKHTIVTVGEAMDTADKSTNKAMSAAMKYACLLTFQIPTEGDNDADGSHHEKGPAEEPDLSPDEKKIGALFALATTAQDIAEAESLAAAAIKEKRVVNGARQRLLKMRADAISRVEVGR